MHAGTMPLTNNNRRCHGRRSVRSIVHDGPQQEHAGDDHDRHQVRAREDRDPRRQSGGERRIASFERQQGETQRPPRRDWHVAHGVHELIEKDRARRQQHGGGETDHRPGDRRAHQIRRPHGGPAKQRHHVKHGAGSCEPLEQRHHHRKARRVYRHDERSLWCGTIAQRRQRHVRERPRDRGHDRLFDLHRAVRPEVRLAQIAVRIGAARHERAFPESERDHRHGRDACQNGREPNDQTMDIAEWPDEREEEQIQLGGDRLTNIARLRQDAGQHADQRGDDRRVPRAPRLEADQAQIQREPPGQRHGDGPGRGDREEDEEEPAQTGPEAAVAAHRWRNLGGWSCCHGGRVSAGSGSSVPCFADRCKPPA